jgi:hypothetical protein
MVIWIIRIISSWLKGSGFGPAREQSIIALLRSAPVRELRFKPSLSRHPLPGTCQHHQHDCGRARNPTVVAVMTFSGE